MKVLLFIIGTCLLNAVVKSAEIDAKYLRCLVCRSTMDEVDGELQKIDPSLEMEIGNYRLDAQGNNIQKKVPMRQSEVQISDILDRICGKMSDYVRATYKSNGQLTIMNLMVDGMMNPEMSKVDIIQDNDLNKSLQYYCEGIVDEFEDSIISLFRDGQANVRRRLCTDTAKLCKPEDFVSEDSVEPAEDDRRKPDDEL